MIKTIIKYGLIALGSIFLIFLIFDIKPKVNGKKKSATAWPEQNKASEKPFPGTDWEPSTLYD